MTCLIFCLPSSLQGVPNPETRPYTLDHNSRNFGTHEYAINTLSQASSIISGLLDVQPTDVAANLKKFYCIQPLLKFLIM